MFKLSKLSKLIRNFQRWVWTYLLSNLILIPNIISP